MMSESQLDSLLRDVVACVAQMPERGEARAQLEAASATRSGRLRWVREHWLPWLPDALRARVLLALDQLAEWESSRGGAAGPAEVPTLHGSSEAHFSDDEDWMRDAVLMAKVAYVWLHQLGVAKLDEIPDTALDQLQARGITALWLIGVWERSPASRDIKRRQGNSEAEASAYALRDYCIASRLGGEEALALLTERARTRGIRLAADMVPNHMGMDSRWMVEHPSWFLQLSAPPFPGYSFDGPDVSGDPAIGVFLEDGYWTQTDAAVVFKCVDRSTGTERFVYHGNDGTQMPWNDTAQLDFLQPEVREAVIGVIVEVARLFPVLRFDAAMTLARQHVQRLWYPSPGSGGAIPSRAVNSVPSAVFERGMPEEFWREVVARVREEAPDTLLVAEAFWMMEGYFVRDLGMHRVYNSAFMHMLRDEDNVRFRASIKEILALSSGTISASWRATRAALGASST